MDPKQLENLTNAVEFYKQEGFDTSAADELLKELQDCKPPADGVYKKCDTCGKRPRRQADYGDFTKFQVQCLMAEYCKSVTLGYTGWGLSFKDWVEVRGIAKHDGNHRLIKLPVVMKIVYVVAWHNGESSGGFDWYHTSDKAERAFEKEKLYADQPEAGPYTAYFFSVAVEDNDADAITDFIDSQLDDLCAKAATRYPVA